LAAGPPGSSCLASSAARRQYVMILFRCPRRPCVILCLQLNRALDLSRNKHAFWQWRFAAMSEKTQPAGAAPAPSSPPMAAVVPDRSSDTLKRSDNAHNVWSYCMLSTPNTIILFQTQARAMCQVPHEPAALQRA
jgi:hypothetical protein